MDLEKLKLMNHDELADVLTEHGLKEEIIQKFKDAEIDGKLFPTLARGEISDMFKVLTTKRSAISAWQEITGLRFDNDGNPTQATSTPEPPRKKARPGVITSDTESEDRDSIASESICDLSSINGSDGSLEQSGIRSRSPPDESIESSSGDTAGTVLSSSQVSSGLETSVSTVVSTVNTEISRDWLKNYKLPNRFSCAVEGGLTKKFLTTNLINEMVRDVCISILNHTNRPKKREREAVAKMIVEEYPFLKDPPISAKTNPWGSLETKIQNRFKKLQRNRATTDVVSRDAPRDKGGKPSRKTKTSWTEVPEETEEKEKVDEMVLDINKEWKKARKDHARIQELMKMTYVRRREMTLVSVQTLREILEEFPPLQNMLYIKADFSRVMGNSDLVLQMKSNFKKTWTPKLLAYCELYKAKHGNILTEMRDAVDSGYQEEECQERAMVKLASRILKPANRKGQSLKDHEEVVVKIVKDQDSLDTVISSIIQPTVVVVNNLFNTDILYVVAEKRIICDITTRKISDAIVTLLAVFYLYSIQYKIGKNVFTFFEMILMGNVAHKTPVSVSTFISILTNVG